MAPLHRLDPRENRVRESRMAAVDNSDSSIDLAALFNMEELQRIQDAFAEATGVASVITGPDGTPITRPSNFCRLCRDIIRNTETGRRNCFRSDAVLGRYAPAGPTVQRCLSAGLWDAGASIHVGGRHLASWLIGQVREPGQGEEAVVRYADAIGADRERFRQALAEVTVMSPGQFRAVADALFLLANQLSRQAYLIHKQKQLLREGHAAEARLRQSEDKFRTIVDSINEFLFVHDPASGAMLDVNKRACDEYGYAKEEMVRLDVAGLSSGLPPHDQAHAEEYMRRAVAGDPQRFEWQARRRSGELFWIEVSIRMARIGNEDRLLVTARDITERKRMQELMVRTEKMMSIAGLAAGMAHEINNPLSGILQGLQVLESRLFRRTPRNEEAASRCGCTLQSLRDYLVRRELDSIFAGIKEAGARAARVVSNMLEFSRMGESNQTPNDIRALLEKAVELCAGEYDLKRKYDFRNIRIEREFDPALPPVPCTAGQMEQVFINLLKNAAQAMTHGTCDAEPPRVMLKVYSDAEEAVVEVADNGPGMSEQVRKHIFEPFFTTKKPGEGTGLGLSVSYFIVTQIHKGTCEVESSPGRGTRFIIRLPLAPS